MVGALFLLVLPAVMLAVPRAGRPGVNPHDRRPADMSITGFDRVSGGLLGLSAAGVLALGLVRIWWHPVVPASRPAGLLAGDSGTWWGLTVAMGGLVLAAFILASMARDTGEQQQDKTFARGYLGPLTLGLACVSAGIFAGGLNLLLPNSHIISPEFHNTGPAISGVARGTYPLVLPAPVYGFMVALLAIGAALLILIIVGIFWFLLQSGGISRVANLNRFYGADLGVAHGLPPQETRSQRWRIARSWTLAKVADYTGVIIAALASAGILGMTAFALVVFGVFPSWPSRIYWVTTLAHDGQWLGLIVTAYLYKLTRDAFSDGGTRRGIGVLWDVGTFWPRASQPFAPPCYMERSVPETVTRRPNRIWRSCKPWKKAVREKSEGDRSVLSGRPVAVR